MEIFDYFCNKIGFGIKATYWMSLKAEMQSRVLMVAYARGNGV
nr:MAG TPA: hypothetical protein [Caudoviricetes sp.]